MIEVEQRLAPLVQCFVPFAISNSVIHSAVGVIYFSKYLPNDFTYWSKRSSSLSVEESSGLV